MTVALERLSMGILAEHVHHCNAHRFRSGTPIFVLASSWAMSSGNSNLICIEEPSRLDYLKMPSLVSLLRVLRVRLHFLDLLHVPVGVGRNQQHPLVAVERLQLPDGRRSERGGRVLVSATSKSQASEENV